MTIRPMEKKDKDSVLTMMRAFYNSPSTLTEPSTEILQQDIENCTTEMPFIDGYVFEKEQRLLGYAMVTKSYSTENGGICLWLEDLYLEPEARGQGIGTNFFQFLEDTYKGLAVSIRLEVTADNSHAIKTYKKMGFTQVEYVTMAKKL